MPIWMRPRVAEHFTHGSGVVTVETEQLATFLEPSSEHITPVPMLCIDAVSPARAAVCPADRDAVDTFASEGARRPFPAPDGRGRLLLRHLFGDFRLVRAASGSNSMPHGDTPSHTRCAR